MALCKRRDWGRQIWWRLQTSLLLRRVKDNRYFMVWSCVMIIITRNKLIGIALVGTIVIYSIGVQYLHAIFLIAGCVFMYCCFAHDILHDSNILNSFAYGSVCSFALITVHCIIDSSGRNHLGIVLLAVSLYFYSLFGISMSMFVVTICLVFKKK